MPSDVDIPAPTDPAAPLPGCGPVPQVPAGQSRPIRLQVFEHVRASGRAARAEISRALGFSPGSATAATADLIARGFLREVEDAPRESGRGRPPVALEVVPERAFVIGVKLTDDHLSAVLTNLAGVHLAEAGRRTAPHRKSLPDMTDEIATLVHDLLAMDGKTRTQIAAIGIGLPGLIDHDAGRATWTPLLDSQHAPLARAVEERLGIDCVIDNDTNMLAMAELWFGAGRETSDFAMVTIEQGVGMGMVLGARLFRGVCGMGLELGHTKVALDGALCRCGQRGCLEAYLADYALAREAVTALGRFHGPPQGTEALLETLHERAQAGDRAAATIFQRAGRYLALGLANVVQLFDPALIILSGERMRYDFILAEEVLDEMTNLTLGQGRPAPRIEVHAWGANAWARGAAALALDVATARMIVEP